MLARNDVGLERAAHVLILARVTATQPVAIAHPQLAPLERRLDVVEEGEALLEELFRSTRIAAGRRRERRDAIGRSLFVAIAKLAAVVESELRFGARIFMAAE